jgi:hypothetical protein
LFGAHASFDGSAGNSFNWASDKIASNNVSGVVRDSEGVYTVTFGVAMASANYTVVASAGFENHTSSARAVSIDSRSATGCTVRVERTDTGTQQDEAYVALIVLA